MNKVIISGIQQIGIGVKNVKEAWGWYKKYFGIDVRILEESAPAEFMLPYTGGKPKNRHAALAVTLQGGGGFEIWNHTDFEPRAASFEIQLGDLGLFAAKIKCKDPEKTYAWFKDANQNLLGPIFEFEGTKHFFIKDPYGNIFQLIPATDWFHEENKLTGGGYGIILGCTDIEKSTDFYGQILGYDKVVYDKTGVFEDFKVLPGGDGEFRRVLLRHSKPREGAFGELFGNSEVELVQVKNRAPRKIFEGRFWGELGFIHLCYDIHGMDNLREKGKNYGCPFTVDTGEIFKDSSFDMGDAAGLFAYIEDPDGALIEFVETHKVPIMKKLGISLNLQKRDPKKPLPRYIVKALRFLKAKDIPVPE
ncbi:MAG: VOC family protein [Bacteroidales bacterium]|nr:VOC family protein [Bacteroidales bacterium]MBN2819345.1 VOC family protein [Bacteroidales bacterium]